MKESFKDILVSNAKNLLALFSSVLLILIGFIPTYLPFSHYFRPDFGLISVYFWTLYRNDIFGIFSAVFLGLIVDTLCGVYLGTNMLVYIFCEVLTIAINRFADTKPFIVSWIGFSIVCLMSLGLKWVIFSALNHRFLSLMFILITYISTVLIYPLIAQMNMSLQNRYLSDDDEVIDEQG